ncbi:MAG TPA: T9SS type A sorting domain-containing protein [Bacteroidales bacterium]|nr:T9SS type A sorting domain-containing protein [Bacteroidales bacterium]
MKKRFTTKTVWIALIVFFISNLMQAQPQGDFIVSVGSANNVKKIILFDTQDGTLMYDDYIILTSLDPGTVKHVIRVQDELWISDQTKDKVHRLDLNGNVLGAIGESGGMDNLRGMGIINNQVWLANSGNDNGAPGNAVIQIDFDGVVTGNFQVDGGPWMSLPYADNHVLISFSDAGGFPSQIGEYDLNGTFLNPWNVPGEIKFIQQITPTANGNYLAASFSNSASGYPSGIHRYDSEGNHIETIGGTSGGGARGCWELGNGNIMWTNGQGTHIADVTTGTSTLVYSGSFQLLEKISFAPAAILDPPTNLVAQLNGTNVSLSWNAPPATDLTGYRIYRDEELLAEVSLTPATYVDEAVPAGTHIYGVSAVYSNGESPKAGPVMITIDGALSKIQGFVRDAYTNISISDAWVSATNTDNGAITSTTPFGSHYVLLLNAGTYDVTCMAQNHQSETIQNIVIGDGMIISYDFYLQPSGGDIYTGISNNGAATVKIYPNPANDHVVVKGKDIKSVQISNQQGCLIIKNQLSSDNQRIDLSMIPAGLYFIKIRTNSETIIQKLIVK